MPVVPKETFLVLLRGTGGRMGNISGSRRTLLWPACDGATEQLFCTLGKRTERVLCLLGEIFISFDCTMHFYRIFYVYYAVNKGIISVCTGEEGACVPQGKKLQRNWDGGGAPQIAFCAFDVRRGGANQKRILGERRYPIRAAVSIS